MKKTLTIFLLFILCSMALACSPVQNIFSREKNLKGQSVEIKDKDPVKLLLYYPDKTMSSLIPEERDTVFRKSLEETIISELLKGSKHAIPFAFPKGTKLLSLKRKGDTVIVNFSGDFIRNFSESNNVGLMTAFSIVNSLTEIPGVKKVELMVKGKAINILDENFKASNPLFRNRGLILRNKDYDPREVLDRQLSLEREGKWLEAYLLYSDDESNMDRKYYHDYVKEMEEVKSLGFTKQDYEIGDYSLDSTGKKAKIKVNFYTPTTYGTRTKSSDIYFNCVKVNDVWMVDWLTAQ